MEIVFDSQRPIRPEVSIILIDWSCRESFHLLDYLANQNIPRSKYEIIWIEYYNRKPRDLDLALKRAQIYDQAPPLDKWIVLAMDENQYYHKHLMYNAGIAASSGAIVTICDSDAVVTKTFVSSIIESFAKERNVVLHMDQVRNREKHYYPFNYPSVEEIIRNGRTNLVNGKPEGLGPTSDPIHTRNYGACMSARRADLIAIGGADEHVDYLGYVCGPYEMTWRLVNFGRTEVWHDHEWLYHVWHPGQLGAENYFGPHDGFHVSTTALQVRQSGRYLPLVENPAINALRLSDRPLAERRADLGMVMSNRDFAGWRISQNRLALVNLLHKATRKFLPRRLKNYVRSSFRNRLKSA